MSSSTKSKVNFKILKVNLTRKQRTQDFIRVEVFEDDLSLGWFWQSPKLIKNNIKKFGEESYINTKEYEKLFNEIKANQ
ncbi:hypothetical protein [Aliarcobacter butzleri]|uniref:Uncharacterized protein n=1 Tax=Aliarcobacter butzleri L348 TaxID=1447256 RepID=A0A0G9K292_9BACT|nr:hypothetical protein [Aliarcobacter butzleri]KLE00612.1 hypothetical protein AA20_05505 [Aliarcobacter butzleri L348]